MGINNFVEPLRGSGFLDIFGFTNIELLRSLVPNLFSLRRSDIPACRQAGL